MKSFSIPIGLLVNAKWNQDEMFEIQARIISHFQQMQYLFACARCENILAILLLEWCYDAFFRFDIIAIACRQEYAHSHTETNV